MSEERTLTTADLAGSQSAEQAAEPQAEGQEPPAGLEPLLGEQEGESFRERWSAIQTRFVDAPREAVEAADALVAELMQQLAQTFASERESLESQWSGGGDASTEDLRVGLQRYRSFFERLLST